MFGRWNLPLNHHGPYGVHIIHTEEIAQATEVGNIFWTDRKRGEQRLGS